MRRSRKRGRERSPAWGPAELMFTGWEPPHLVTGHFPLSAFSALITCSPFPQPIVRHGGTPHSLHVVTRQLCIIGHLTGSRENPYVVVLTPYSSLDPNFMLTILPRHLASCGAPFYGWAVCPQLGLAVLVIRRVRFRLGPSRASALS